MRGSNLKLSYSVEGRRSPREIHLAAYKDCLSALVEDIQSARENGRLSETEVRFLLKLAIRRQVHDNLSNLVSRTISPLLTHGSRSPGEALGGTTATENDYAG